eukprot:766271-Prymnesium_polylepis.1
MAWQRLRARQSPWTARSACACSTSVPSMPTVGCRSQVGRWRRCLRRMERRLPSSIWHRICWRSARLRASRRGTPHDWRWRPC